MLGWSWNQVTMLSRGSCSSLISRTFALQPPFWARHRTELTKCLFNTLTISISSVISFSPSFHDIFGELWALFDKRGLTVFQKVLLSVILLRSRFSWYFCLSFLNNLLQKFLCFLKAFLFSFVGRVRYLVAKSDRFIMAFRIAFVTYGLWLALCIFFFLGACLSNTFSNFSSKSA